MGGLYWLAIVWPGFPQGWYWGRWSRAFLAILFSGTLGGAAIATWFWHVGGGASGQLAGYAWLAVAGLWLIGLMARQRDREMLREGRLTPDDPEIDEWFRQAQHQYLKGHWLEAESLLDRLLSRNSHDAEAQLLKASIHRRTGRYVDAKRGFTALQEYPAAQRWRVEIAAEMKQLSDAEQSPAETPEPQKLDQAA